ncbi:MAG: hypothetical protein ACPGN3_02135 [Opitutales bacterium]
MNPLNLRLLWKGLTGRSLVFSLLFATAVLGYSGAGAIRDIFGAIGVPWWLVWIVPFVLIGAIAKREEKWLPNEKYRKWVSYGIVAFSIGFGYLLWSMEQDAKQYDPPKEIRRPKGRAGER